MNKQAALDKLHTQVTACTKCVLHQGRTQAVPGEGSVDADIMFIGEGPGKNEDVQGRPFVGAAGKLLEQMLALINLKREDVFIANVVKCHPPDNRDPKPEEVAACWPYLAAQIKIIKPKLIVTLGRHSMDRFVPNARISEIHGQPKRVKGQVYYPVYHPAATMYRGTLKEDLARDFMRIPAVLKKIAALPAPKLKNAKDTFIEDFFAK